MAHRLPPRSPQTSRSSNEGWPGSPLANQARERYLAAERLWSLAEEHRRRAAALEAEAQAEEALGDHLAHQAVRRKEHIRPEHQVLPWVVRVAQEQAQVEAAEAARALRQAVAVVEAEDRRQEVEAHRKEVAAAAVEARRRVEAQRHPQHCQRKQVRFQVPMGP